jgi:hypothetical protein
MFEEVILASRRAIGECRLKGLRPQGALGVYDMVGKDTFWLDKGDRDGISAETGLGHILPGSKTI